MFMKTRTTIVALVATSSFAVATVAPAVSQAQPNNNTSKPEGCEVHTTGDAYYVVPEGTKLTIKYPDGEKETKECKNGQWVKVAQISGTSTVGVIRVPVLAVNGPIS
jgi:hypothetical protein